MKIETARDLFVYELGLTRGLERMGDRMLSEIAFELDNPDLRRLLHEGGEHRDRQSTNIDACLEVVGFTPLGQRAPLVEALRERYFNFKNTNPSSQALNLYAIGTALRFTEVVIATYRELMALADLAGETECRRRLEENCRHKIKYEEALVQYGVEVGLRIPVAP
ncbi:MAG TPA: DUF892 family protein [Micromonosporaceae bacterium]